MDDNFVNEIIELHKKHNWREIVGRYYGHPERNKLLWVFPSEENLMFLKNTLEELGCHNALSIGCGSGLLEWIITQSTGIATRGVEIDGAWWACKYSPPNFIPLLFTHSVLDEDIKAALRHSSCILFCYFNDRPAFEGYMEHYCGDALVVIGPGAGRDVHTEPRPFGDCGPAWMLYKWQEVRDSKDFIVVYKRRRPDDMAIPS